MVGAEAGELDLAAADLGLERIEADEAPLERRGPGLGQLERREQLPSPDPEEVRHRDRVAEGDERGVDPVLDGGAVACESEPMAGTLALGAGAQRVGIWVDGQPVDHPASLIEHVDLQLSARQVQAGV